VGSELRKDPRVSGYAKALLVGQMTPGYIRNLSRSGCQVAFMQSIAAAVGDLITIRVIAEHDTSIPPFEIFLRVRWVRPDPLWWALGGEVESMGSPQDREVFEKIVDYYAGTPV
jgi:hypothetical protein